MMPEHVDRLALAVHALRPDWPAQSLRTFIATKLAHKPALDASLALVWVAIDPASDTPARVLQEGAPWWRAGNPTGQNTAPLLSDARSGQTCAVCHRDEPNCRRAAELTSDPHEFTQRTAETTARPRLTIVQEDQ